MDIDDEILQLIIQKHPSAEAVIAHIGENDIRSQSSEVFKNDFKRLNNIQDPHKQCIILAMMVPTPSWGVGVGWGVGSGFLSFLRFRVSGPNISPQAFEVLMFKFNGS